MRNHFIGAGWLALLITAPLAAQQAAGSDSETAANQAEERVELRYRFREGEAIRWKVTHMATTETRIQGNSQESKSRSVSTKRWQVDSVAENGNITLTHSVENVEMWQELTDRPEVRYNSREDETPPPEYEAVASTIGVPLTTVTISPDGRVIERKNGSGQPAFGLGDIVMLLPPKPVKVGSKWHEPSEIPMPQENGQIKRIKIRKRYELESLKTGVATISIKTEVLTPVKEESVRAKLVQQLVNGTIKFDVDAGRVLSKQMDWDETVVGFNGNASMMKYLARFTEELLPAVPKTAAAQGPTRN